MDELAAAHRRHNAESEALQESRSLVTSLSEQAATEAAKAVEAARASTVETVQEFIFSACRHLYFQRAELQLLLHKLAFCAAELQGNVPRKLMVCACHTDMSGRSYLMLKILYCLRVKCDTFVVVLDASLCQMYWTRTLLCITQG